MDTVNIHQAKTHLSRYLEQVEAGGEIVIARGGRPVAKLMPLAPKAKKKIVFGSMKGQLRIAEDFDSPIADAVLAAFEGR